MLVSVVRHGESVANVAGTLSGGTDNAALTELGRKQAQQTAEAVKKREHGIELIVSSPMDRALHTAQVIAQVLGYEKEIVKTELAIERIFGEATGKPIDVAFEMLDNGFVEGAETVQEFGERIQKLLELLKQYPEKHILLVTHGAVAQMFGTLASGGKPEDFLNHPKLHNAQIQDLEI